MSNKPADETPDERLDRIEAVARSETERLANDPNIIGVGYGIKRTAGEIVPGIALRYIVHRKLPDAITVEAVGSEPIPPEVDGFPTDVIETGVTEPDDKGPPTGNRGSAIEDPLVGGTSTTVLAGWHSIPTGYGTLGGICFDEATSDALALSNAHIWGDTIGADVIQPWLPAEEYLGAVVELLACGPVISYLVEGVVPSPLTGALTIAAAVAWAAFVALDEEDPNRWGQRTSGQPPVGSITSVERVHLTATVPPRPFPGLPYTAGVTWDYTRESTTGDSSAPHRAENQTNEHVLVGTKVWTDRSWYYSGDRVEICAEIDTAHIADASGLFVVAHCFATDHRDRMYSRVLRPGRCETTPAEEERCFHGFPPPASPGGSATFPFAVDAFRFEAGSTSHFMGPFPDTPEGVTTLAIPWQGLTVRTPPTSAVSLDVVHFAGPIEARAYDVGGALVATGATSLAQDVAHHLELTGSAISRVELSSGNGEGFLIGGCVRVAVKEDHQPGPGTHRHHFRGHLDLPPGAPSDRWSIVLFVQAVGDVPRDVDPLTAARAGGGVTLSANVASLDECSCAISTDHVFDVI